MTRVYNKTCATCGKEFAASDPRKMCCSDVCTRAYKVKYQTAYKMRRRADRVCAVCGGVIDKHVDGRRKYCSEECSHKVIVANRKKSNHWYKPKNHQAVKCKHCGKEFIQRSVSNIYCSRKCQRAETSSSYVKRKDKLKVACVVCGTEFTAFRKDKKTCSSKCYKLWYRSEHSSGRELIHRECEYCGEKFETLANAKRFCSVGCRNLACYHRHNESKERRMRRESGLTQEQIDAVIYAQDNAPKGKLWELSQNWTVKQREFARKRYCNKYEISGTEVF